MERLNTQYLPALVPQTVPAIVFVFSTDGAQSFDIGKELFRTCELFRESILGLDQVYASIVGTSLIESTGLFNDTEDDPMGMMGYPWPAFITLPALTMLQLALVDALAAAGVRPDVVVGYSAGEVAVLYASGASSKVVALKLAIARGRALSLLEDANGAMAGVSCTADKARSIIHAVRAELGVGALQIGCYNAPGALTFSGEEAHVELAVAKATAACIFARRLTTRIPLHSTMVEACRAEFMHFLSDIFPPHEQLVPKIPVYSSVTGGPFDGPFDGEYFWDGAVQPVLFQDAIEELLLRYEGATFVEIGPHSVLTSFLSAMTEGTENVTVSCALDQIEATGQSAVHVGGAGEDVSAEGDQDLDMKVVLAVEDEALL